jgi:hypothetical protein
MTEPTVTATLLRYVVAAILALLIMTSTYGGRMDDAVRAAGMWWLITLGVFLGIAWVMQSLLTVVSRWKGTR